MDDADALFQNTVPGLEALVSAFYFSLGFFDSD